MYDKKYVVLTKLNGDRIPVAVDDIEKLNQHDSGASRVYLKSEARHYFITAETPEQITGMLVGDLKCELPDFMTAALHHAKSYVGSVQHIFEFYRDEQEADYPQQFALYRRVMPDKVKMIYRLLEVIQSGDKERIDLALENCKKVSRGEIK